MRTQPETNIDYDDLRASRLTVSGRILDADAARRLVAALHADALPAWGPFSMDWVGICGSMGDVEEGPWVLRDDHRGRSAFLHTREILKELGLPHVHEVETSKGAWSIFRDASRSEEFVWSGTIAEPVLMLSELERLKDSEDFVGAATEWMAAVSACRMSATAPFVVDAAVLDEVLRREIDRT